MLLHCSDGFDIEIVYGDGFEGGFIDGLDLMVGLYVDGEIDGFDVGAIGASMPWIVGGFQFHFGFGLMVGFSTV